MCKEEIRKKLKIKRKYLGEILRSEYNLAIAETFLNAFSSYNSFFIYNSYGTEAGTDAIISSLVNSGKDVYLPRTEGKNILPVPVTPQTQYKRGAFGIYEPLGDPFAGKIEVTVIPLLAINSRGYRIGYGGGYYDRYLKDNPTKKVGLGYGFQMEEFKEDAFDVPLEIYVCERGIYTFEK